MKPSACESADHVAARIEAIERKLESHDKQLREIKRLLAKLLRHRQRRIVRFEHPLADQLQGQIEKLPRSPFDEPLRPIWK